MGRAAKAAMERYAPNMLRSMSAFTEDCKEKKLEMLIWLKTVAYMSSIPTTPIAVNNQKAFERRDALRESEFEKELSEEGDALGCALANRIKSITELPAIRLPAAENTHR